MNLVLKKPTASNSNLQTKSCFPQKGPIFPQVQNGFISPEEGKVKDSEKQFVPVLFTVYLLHELRAPTGAAGADRAGNCSCSCGEGCGGRAVAARRARRSRDTVVGRPAPHARWSPVGHRPAPLGSQGQRKKRAHTHAFVLSVHLLLIAHCMCTPQCFPR